MSFKRYLANKLIDVLPPTRMYGLKVWLMNWSGARLNQSVRMVSSANIWGQGIVEIGSKTFLGHQLLIVSGAKGVKIGANADIGPRVTIVTGTHEIDMKGANSAGDGYSEEIVIEDGVWLGAGATVIHGVRIGKKAIIGAGSVVTKSIPSDVIAVGNPCRPIKRWDHDSNSWVRITD